MNASDVIAAFGGTTETAKLCGVTPSAVSQWRENGIPRAWAMFLRQLRPDLFEPSETSADGAPAVPTPTPEPAKAAA